MALFQKLDDRFYFKIIVIGDSGVGKTTLSKRITTNIFYEDLKKTIGVELYSKDYYIENLKYTLLIWDYSGEDRFKPLLEMWVKGTAGGLLVYDITNYKSFIHLGKWIHLIKRNTNNNFPIILIGTHLDLEEKREVPKYKVKNIAHLLRLPYFECSSKNGDNINQIFQTLIEYLYFSKNGI